jgi:uncharacterized small protein (DUF1192 family)
MRFSPLFGAPRAVARRFSQERKMDIDDLEPRKQPSKPKDLSVYSIEDLRAYIDVLKAEIARAEATIAKKSAHKEAASSVFKK